MNKEEAVKEPAEQTAEMGSAPVETKVDDSQETPMESTPSEKKVSETVPYERFQEVNEKAKRVEELEAKIAELESQSTEKPTQPGEMGNTVPFDPETAQALDTWYAKRREADKEQDFIRRHKDELKDPLLAGAVRQLIAEGNAKGKYVDQEEALIEAKKLLDERLNPQIRQAQEQGVAEGQKIAHQKEMAGAVGESRAKEKVKPEELSAKEFAEYYNLPRTE